MNTYFERLEEIVRRHEQEIDHLKAERLALRQEESNMSFDNFNREYQRIIYYLENETRSLNDAQNTLDNYHFNYDKAESLINDLRNLRKELDTATSRQDENAIQEEITAKEEELRKAIDSLPLELADYLRNSIIENDKQKEINDNKANLDVEIPFQEENPSLKEIKPNHEEDQTKETINSTEIQTNDTLEKELQEKSTLDLSVSALADYEAIAKEIAKIKEAQDENSQLLQETINRIQEIFQEQRDKYEKEGPFNTETLDRLQEYYMGLKISENEVFLELKRNQVRLSRRLKSLEKKQQQVIEIDNISKAFEISYVESKELFKTLNNRKIITQIFAKKGLNDLIHKSSRTKSEKELLKKTLEEIRNEIITYRKTNKDTSIKDTINVLYGMDEKIKKSQSKDKELVMPSADIIAMHEKMAKLPAVIRKPDINNATKNKPLESPKDIPNPKKQDTLFALKDDLLNKDLSNNKEQTSIVNLSKDELSHDNINEASDKTQPKLDNNGLIIPAKTNENHNQVEPKEKQDQRIASSSTNSTEKPKVKRGLREIIGNLRQGLEIGKKDGQRYRRSNLKVSQNFKNELQSGNVLYNIVHVVPATIKVGTEFLEKISGKVMLSTSAEEMMNTLKQRIDDLSYEDLETIYKEYRGSRINQERYPQALNMVIEQKMSEYVLGKVTVLNEDIEKSYANVIYTQNLLKAIDNRLRKGKISSEEKLKRLEQRKEILKTASSNIKYIRDAKIEADNLLSSGLHGLSEDIKASASKLNCIGMRFAKSHDLDNDLEDALMECEKRENQAIYNDDDEELLKAFIESEVLLSKNTEITNSLVGKRSTGKKYYSPLAEQLDYRNDPFIRDLFTTIAVTTATLNAATALKNQANSNNGLFKADDELLNKVHKAGEDITAKRGAMYEGMRAQANQDVLTGAGTIERTTLDTNGWEIGTDAYHAADHAGHEFYNDFYNDVQEKIANVTRNYNGVGNQAQILQDLSQVANDSHATLVNVADKCLEILKPYAQNNPQFDLSAFQDTMEFVLNHPNAIANMNQAMVDGQNIGEELVSLSESQLAMLNNLPNNLGPSILSAVSACALATTVSKTMGTKRKEYGNNVTDMINEYAYSEEVSNSPKTI